MNTSDIRQLDGVLLEAMERRQETKRIADQIRLKVIELLSKWDVDIGFVGATAIHVCSDPPPYLFMCVDPDPAKRHECNDFKCKEEPPDSGHMAFDCGYFTCKANFTCLDQNEVDFYCSKDNNCKSNFVCDAGHVFGCDDVDQCIDGFKCTPGGVGCGDPDPGYTFPGADDPGDFVCAVKGGIFNCMGLFNCDGLDDFDCGWGGGTRYFNCKTNFNCMGKGDFTCPDFDNFSCKQGFNCVPKGTGFDCPKEKNYQCPDGFTCPDKGAQKFDCNGGGFGCVKQQKYSKD